MAKMKAALVSPDAEITLYDGALAVPVTTILGTAGEASARGIVVASDRGEWVTTAPDGKLVSIVASVYVQRSPLTDAETSAIHAAEADRTVKQTAREAKMQAQLDAERRSAARIALDVARDFRR